MNFEQALRTELNTITQLNNKVYPLVAPKGIDVPFLIYRKNSLAFNKTLNGTHNQVEAMYSITIVTNTYQLLQEISESVIELFKSFQSRSIGNSVFIKNILIDGRGDQYESEIDLYRTDIQIKVNY